jgi:hypothetical protein
VDVYELKDRVLAPLVSGPGWCDGCGGPCAAEILPSYIALVRSTLLLETEFARSARHEPVLAHQVDALQRLLLRSKRHWPAWLAQQQGRQPRCLQCGGVARRFVPVAADANELVYRHPGCEGELHWAAAEAPRLRPRRLTLRFFTPDGRLALDGDRALVRTHDLLDAPRAARAWPSARATAA